MSYKRLTKYNKYNHNAEVYAYTVGKEDIYFDGVDIVGNENSSLAQETIDKLALLEDKIENGTLIELPCKVGDTVWVIDRNDIVECKVLDYCINKKDYYFYSRPTHNQYLIRLFPEHLGIEWFYTKAEAEEKLKELQNESNNL